LRIIQFTVNIMTGKIKTKKDTGFGFIDVDGEEKDLFFHSTSLIGVSFDDVREGDAVTFDIEDSEKGPRAANVRLASADMGA